MFGLIKFIISIFIIINCFYTIYLFFSLVSKPAEILLFYYIVSLLNLF